MKTHLKWLVAIDGSDSSEQAFNYTLAAAKEHDEIILLAVSEKIQATLYTHAYVSMDFVLEAQHKIDDSNKAALRRHARAAHAAGFKNVHLLLATSDHPGEMICQAAKEKHVDTIVLGRRGMGAIKRLILGSVSRFVVENATCDVIVVKSPVGPAEQHDATKGDIKKAEEKEKQRRVAEEHAIEQTEAFNSALDRNVARMAEEAERRRRMEEFEARHKLEQAEREKKLLEVKRLEEEERRARMATDPEAKPHLPEPEIHFAYIPHKK